MIDLYSGKTPNGQKIHIMLEETGLDYNTVWINMDTGDQFTPEFLKVSPNNKIPAILDHDGPGGAPISVFESGAILIYLAEKTGQFLPAEPGPRWEVLQWLYWQMGGFGPMLGQAHHFRAYAPQRGETHQYAIDRYTNEAFRLYSVLDKRLSDTEYVAGEYSIADMAIFPWCRLHGRQGQKLDDFPNVKRWFDQVAARPAVARDMAELEDKPGSFTEQSWSALFGDEQYKRRPTAG